MPIDRNSHVPVYLQVKDCIEQYIVDHNLKEGDPLPTLHEICDMTGVSLRTAQTAVKAMQEGGTGNRQGKRLTVGQKYSQEQAPRKVYIICPGVKVSEDILSTRILDGIREEAGCDNSSEVVFTGSDPVSSINYYRQNKAMQICGVIMLHWQDREALAKLARSFPDMRFVHTNYYLEKIEELPENICGVFNDDFGGAYQAAEYLIGLGCRCPVFLELEILDQVYRERRAGFMAALQDQKLEGHAFVQKNRLDIALSTRMRMYRQFFTSILHVDRDFDGVATCNDSMAIAAVNVLQEMNMDVPVIGYDDYSECSDRKVTTMAVDYAGIGRGAVRQLNSRLPRFHKLMPRLKVRKINAPDTSEFTLNIVRVVNN